MDFLGMLHHRRSLMHTRTHASAHTCSHTPHTHHLAQEEEQDWQAAVAVAEVSPDAWVVWADNAWSGPDQAVPRYVSRHANEGPMNHSSTILPHAFSISDARLRSRTSMVRGELPISCL